MCFLSILGKAEGRRKGVSVERHILIIDDDARLRTLLIRYVQEQGYFATGVSDAASARAVLAVLRFDLMVLDCMMPGEDGISLAASLRAAGNTTPILMLTARTEAGDRIAGLEAGVDDYLTKPFEPRELMLRMDAILRRAVPLQASGSAPLLLGYGYRWDGQSSQLQHRDAPIYLTAQELALLSRLASRPGEIVPREALMLEGGDSASRTVDVQITRLRRKIAVPEGQPHPIQSVRGQGYVLRPVGR